MCGIAGIWFINGRKVERSVLQKMNDRLSHRGPDDEGIWISADGKVGLAHRRLSILDLSPMGRQPMHSASGRYVIVFNGEVYNFKHLQEELEKEGFVFRGGSDTEVMLAAFEKWGIHNATKKFIGMFAFCVWDKMERRVHLVRDRLGVKPLYYAGTNRCLAFASELRSLAAAELVSGELSLPALRSFLQYGYVMGRNSILEGVERLGPGEILTFTESGNSSLTKYWDINEVVAAGQANPWTSDEGDAITTLDRLLRDSVRLRMISDVPLGAFLSGGIDSSTVVALMQSQSARPVKTFSIGVYDNAYNEGDFAKAVARHLGTDHTELYVTEQDVLANVPTMARIYDEPFADPSQIPTYLVSKLAREQVTVSLSGDGGDELFGGYNRYIFVDQFWKKLRWVPRSLRQFAGCGLKSIPTYFWDGLFNTLSAVLPARFNPSLAGQKLHKVGNILASKSVLDLHSTLVSHWTEKILDSELQGKASKSQYSNFELGSLNDVDQQMVFDTATWLVDDILTKVDRATMSVGLEGRVPILDHRVVEFVWRLPLRMKIRNAQSKWILRQVLYRYVPPELVERKKMGFSIPIEAWLRGPLRSWAHDILLDTGAGQNGILDKSLIRRTWEQHLGGAVDRSYPLWIVLMFKLWLEEKRSWN